MYSNKVRDFRNSMWLLIVFCGLALLMSYVLDSALEEVSGEQEETVRDARPANPERIGKPEPEPELPPMEKEKPGRPEKSPPVFKRGVLVIGDDKVIHMFGKLEKGADFITLGEEKPVQILDEGRYGEYRYILVKTDTGERGWVRASKVRVLTDDL